MRTEIEAARSATSGSQFASGILLDLSARRSTPRHATLRCAIAIATRYTAEERTAIYCNKCSGGAGFSLKKEIQGAIDPRLKIMAIIRADRYTMAYYGAVRVYGRALLRTQH